MFNMIYVDPIAVSFFTTVLLSTLSEDGEVELIKLDDVIEDIDELKDLLKNNA